MSCLRGRDELLSKMGQNVSTQVYVSRVVVFALHQVESRGDKNSRDVEILCE